MNRRRTFAIAAEREQAEAAELVDAPRRAALLQRFVGQLQRLVELILLERGAGLIERLRQRIGRRIGSLRRRPFRTTGRR